MGRNKWVIGSYFLLILFSLSRSRSHEGLFDLEIAHLHGYPSQSGGTGKDLVGFYAMLFHLAITMLFIDFKASLVDS